jgi:hypothetical protein
MHLDVETHRTLMLTTQTLASTWPDECPQSHRTSSRKVLKNAMGHEPKEFLVLDQNSPWLFE